MNVPCPCCGQPIPEDHPMAQLPAGRSPHFYRAIASLHRMEEVARQCSQPAGPLGRLFGIRTSVS